MLNNRSGSLVCCGSIVAVSECVVYFCISEDGSNEGQDQGRFELVQLNCCFYMFLLWISPANQHSCEQWTWIFHHYLWGFSSPTFWDIHRHSHMTPYTNTCKSHQQTWNSNPTSSATPIPSPLMKKHMIKMQTKTMIENCSFALLINDILLKMNLNNRNNMSTMNCTSDIYI